MSGKRLSRGTLDLQTDSLTSYLLSQMKWMNDVNPLFSLFHFSFSLWFFLNSTRGNHVCSQGMQCRRLLLHWSDVTPSDSLQTQMMRRKYGRKNRENASLFVSVYLCSSTSKSSLVVATKERFPLLTKIKAFLEECLLQTHWFSRQGNEWASGLKIKSSCPVFSSFWSLSSNFQLCNDFVVPASFS